MLSVQKGGLDMLISITVKCSWLDSVSRWDECVRQDDRIVQVVRPYEKAVQNPQWSTLYATARHRRSPVRADSVARRSRAGPSNRRQMRAEAVRSACVRPLSLLLSLLRRTRCSRFHQVSRWGLHREPDKTVLALRETTWCGQRVAVLHTPAQYVRRERSDTLLAILRGVLGQRRQRRENVPAAGAPVFVDRGCVAPTLPPSSCPTTPGPRKTPPPHR